MSAELRGISTRFKFDARCLSVDIAHSPASSVRTWFTQIRSGTSQGVRKTELEKKNKAIVFDMLLSILSSVYKHYVNRLVVSSYAFSPSHHSMLNNLLTQEIDKKTVQKHHTIFLMHTYIISMRMILYILATVYIKQSLASMHSQMTQFDFQLHKHILRRSTK